MGVIRSMEDDQCGLRKRRLSVCGKHVEEENSIVEMVHAILQQTEYTIPNTLSMLRTSCSSWK